MVWMGLAVATCITANAVRPTDMQSMINEENNKCESGEDSMACIKVRAMRFLDSVISKDNFKLADVEVRSNGFQPTPSDSEHARSQESNFLDIIENYIRGHDAVVSLPIAGAETKITVSSRNLNTNEFNLNLKFDDDSDDVVEGKGKKRRLRKIVMPIMVLILLKAMTIIPMAIGILKIKAFNALALGFFSFIVSVGLAIFQLCKKIAAEHHSAHITAHGPWDGRSVDASPLIYSSQPLLNNNQQQQQQQNQQLEAAQDLAYSAYV